MKRARGRPSKNAAEAKAAHLQVRLNSAEKEVFTAAAELAGVDLSEWVRARLRLASQDEFGKYGEPIPFQNDPSNKKASS